MLSSAMEDLSVRTFTLRAAGDRIAMTVFLPEVDKLSGCVIFASPGGGYGRGYYDMAFDGHRGYSQAAHHTAHGHVVVAYDHLGVGDSSTAGVSRLTIEDIAAANHEAATEVQVRIQSGCLCEGFPALPDAFHVGIGQSMGGGVTIIMQARHHSFDAIGVLGYSAIHTMLPQRTLFDLEAAKAQYSYSRATVPAELSVERSSAGVADFVYPFHWEDVPRDILALDMEGGYPLRQTAPPFGSLTIPNCAVAMMSPGYVREEAAEIEAPVFLAYGERDVSADPHAEPGAFTAARDISLLVVPRMAHMHNFAGTRRRLWDRLSAWAADRAAT
jgi:pimeloyl-ACP methyl ester carboxylesterase